MTLTEVSNRPIAISMLGFWDPEHMAIGVGLTIGQINRPR
jgi:hypothetical protein